MSNILEYIWLDGYGNIRNKVRVVPDTCKEAPMWRFDGGSTGQGSVACSDKILNPVKVYHDSLTDENIVLCEVLFPDLDPHPTNYRRGLVNALKEDTKDIWVGVEQEFTITKVNGMNITPEMNALPGNSYCTSMNLAENIIAVHANKCLDFGLRYEGFNAEVTYGQWEFQIGAASPVEIADDLIVARHLLNRVCAHSRVYPSFDPKPFEGENGAGCHINISTIDTRKEMSEEALLNLAWCFEDHHDEHMQAYGEGNERRMTGKNETSHYEHFTIGIGDRSSSIRIADGKPEAYIEDRRPAANIEPYQAFATIVNTLNLYE